MHLSSAKLICANSLYALTRSHFKTCRAMFLEFKEFELYWGAVFFLRSVHTFS